MSTFIRNEINNLSLNSDFLKLKIKDENGNETKNFNISSVEDIDSLIEQLNRYKESKIQVKANYTINEDGESIVIVNKNDNKETTIDKNLFNNEILNVEQNLNYTLELRESRIDDLEMWIIEAEDESQKYLMREDLSYLLNSKEEYVLGFYGTNGFIASDVEPEDFNEACNEIVESYNKHLTKKLQTEAKQYEQTQEQNINPTSNKKQNNLSSIFMETRIPKKNH